MQPHSGERHTVSTITLVSFVINLSDPRVLQYCIQMKEWLWEHLDTPGTEKAVLPGTLCTFPRQVLRPSCHHLQLLTSHNKNNLS